MDLGAKEWVGVQQEQATVESDKEQLEKLTVCVVSYKKVHRFVDQKKKDLGLAEC